MDRYSDHWYSDRAGLEGPLAKSYEGKKLKQIREFQAFEADALAFEFEDGSVLNLVDQGQDCCAHHYVTVEEGELAYYAGAEFRGFGVAKAGTCEEDEWGGCHEIEFLEVHTDRGVLSLAFHNEHNGYYGGISLQVAAG